jgi:hypothetical protein
MINLIKEAGYQIRTQSRYALTGTETSIDIDGQTVYLQNAGTNKIYMAGDTGVSTDHWEIPSGVTSGPWSARGKLYFVSPETSTLKVLFIEGV